MAESDGAKPISLFYSYAHEDEDLRLKLQAHLSALRRANLISELHDRDIDAGDDWAREIDQKLATADIILLLISAHFINSDYCWSVEMTRALKRHDEGAAKVIPVILRPCRWRINSKIAKLQATPTDGKPVTSWPDQDAAFDDVAGKIQRVVEELRHAEVEQATELAFQMQRDEPHQLPPDTEESARRLGDVALDLQHRSDCAIFEDGPAPWCLQMAVIPAGKFMMGSPEREEGRAMDEGPQRQVTIGRFALGCYPVTFGEFDHFCQATGWHNPGDMGWGRDKKPVINVNWHDAVAYCDWLSKQTGRQYRLPSEAEWEYACRAGTMEPFWFGSTITTEQANYNGNEAYGTGNRGNYREKTTKVGTFPPNTWGLYDMHGNVWEWVEDVWHPNYERAPKQGVAWLSGPDERDRVLRGGSWHSGPKCLRSARRYWRKGSARTDKMGFRVAASIDV